AASFGRTIRRLDDLAVVAYDRRGYGHSNRSGPPATLDRHITDLLDLLDGLPRPDQPVTAVGHSLGGDVVIGAAIAEPRRFSSVGAFEPPMPWLGFRRPASPHRAGPPPADRRPTGPWPPPDLDPAQEAERFFRRMVGDAAWEHLPEATRAARRSEGPALVADLAGMRGPPPFDVETLAVPALIGRGGPGSEPHHRQTAAWLASHLAGGELFDVDAARHGAHLSHPDAFAAFVRRAVALAGHGAPVGPDAMAAATTDPAEEVQAR
ncbi:MAG TPA: alpha/beta hydrolase, partial [Acidimicrobiales bacterium]|nr:alpha/beta hydrolase [Acidimicrobiales bacterium]